MVPLSLGETPIASMTVGGEPSIVEGTFRVIETLKGQPPADGKIWSLVFGPGGSFGTFNLKGTEPKRRLEGLRKLSAAAK